MENSKKAKPTAEDLHAASRLKAIWLSIPRAERPTQETLAHRYGEGANQSLISQYMNGLIPLNVRAVLFFARELNCRPDEIYPQLPGLEYANSPHADTDKVPARAEASTPADEKWSTFSAEQKNRILQLVEIAGLIAKPGTASMSRKVTADDLRQSDNAAERRRQRKARRGARATNKKNVS